MIENFVEYCKKREGDLVNGKLDNDDLICFEDMHKYWNDYVKLFIPRVVRPTLNDKPLIEELNEPAKLYEQIEDEQLKTFPMPNVIEAMERVQDLIVRSQPKPRE